MAKLNIDDKRKELQEILDRYSSYDSFKSSKNYIVFLNLLISCANEFCPFTGVLYPYRKFAIEHFHHRQATNPEKSLELNNLYPIVGDANLPTAQYLDTLDPKLANYPDRFYIDEEFKVQPKDTNDISAINTIKQYKLDSSNQLSAYRAMIFQEVHILKTNQAKKYSFCEYF